MPGVPASKLPQAITLEALEKRFRKALTGKPDARALDFLAQAFEDYAADETPELGGDDLAVLLAGVWKAAEGAPMASRRGSPSRR
jgi:glutamate dehydrogenase